ncbi:hypothetical protein [Romboutsia lituseburensis]|uniref:Uncharacterized protein n=2 Tax=root TaxID=1 RepID=A0A1G9L0J9_9FIRM|nr:hypothetical protein [Romboutsia lituseburensis]MCR8744947.1 hypothetical protein [Romboutsia lituseburensis]CEH35101.1 Hypothetical protein RLITU_2522 [Romboutsia lituseburensis]SDL55518.1 hypothetical protein SAMN04515677_102336 [Romboutsia lituseburensis DSM 797]
MNENNLNQGNLDFEKMNATLADPEFANWYYNEMLNKLDSNLTMDEFINIINSYNQNKLQ